MSFWMILIWKMKIDIVESNISKEEKNRILEMALKKQN